MKNDITEAKEKAIVYQVELKKERKKYRSENGWSIDWEAVPDSIMVYALALEKTKEVQGLVGLKDDVPAHAVYIHWMSSAPHNNKIKQGIRTFNNVGEQLFRIAVNKSVELGYEGVVHGFATSLRLLKHYMRRYGAKYLGLLHQYHFFIDEEQAKKLLEENFDGGDET